VDLILPTQQERAEIAKKAHEYFDTRVVYTKTKENYNVAICLSICVAITKETKSNGKVSVDTTVVNQVILLPPDVVSEEGKLKFVINSLVGYSVKNLSCFLVEIDEKMVQKLKKELEVLGKAYCDNLLKEFFNWMDELVLKYKDFNARDFITSIYFKERFEIATPKF